MAIISVKSNRNRAWKGNKFHLSTSLYCTSNVQRVHILLFSDLYKEKHATFEFNPFLHFNPDRDVLLQELNTVCHVPTQGIENLESSLWPADDNWPKENRWLERKESHYNPSKTTDFRTQPSPPCSPPHLGSTGSCNYFNWNCHCLIRLNAHHHINRI